VIEVILVSGHRRLAGPELNPQPWRSALEAALVEIKDAIRWRQNSRLLVISGAAKGPDSWALEWAAARYHRGVLPMAWPVSWQAPHGGFDSHAAFERDSQMVSYVAWMARRPDVYAHGLFVTDLSLRDMTNPQTRSGTAQTYRYWLEQVTPDSDVRTVHP
jgi:hypothetical protein